MKSSSAAVQRNKKDQEKKDQEANERALDEYHERVVAETFASLDLVHVKKTLGQYVVAYEELKKENAALAKDIQDRDRDSLQVVDFLRNELDARNRKLEDANKRLQSCSTDFNNETTRLRGEYTLLIDAKDSTIASLKGEIDHLNRQVEEVGIFRRERQEILREMESLRDKHASMVQHYEKELTKLRFQTLDEKVRLKAAEAEMTRAFNSEVDARATVLVDVKAKNIHDNNKHLVQDKAMLEREVSDLVHLASEVKEELKSVKRDAQIDAELQQQTTKHTARLNMIAQEADARAQKLEAKLVKASAAFDARVSELQNDAKGRISSLEGQLRQAKSALDTHRSELLKLRELSTKIVSQRGELERFFYEALEEVQRQRELTATSSGAGGKQLGGGLSSPRSHFASSGPSQALSPRLVSAGSATGRYSAQVGNNNSSNTWYSLTQREGGRRFSSLSGQQPVDQNGLVTTPATAPRSYQRRAPPGSDSADTNAALPTLVDGGNAPMLDVENNDGVQFGSLTWAEKERVIRSLLYFINTAYYSSGGSASSSAAPSEIPRLQDGHSRHGQQETEEADGRTAGSGGMGSVGLAALTPILASGRDTASSAQCSSAGGIGPARFAGTVQAVPAPPQSHVRDGAPPLAPRHYHQRQQQQHAVADMNHQRHPQSASSSSIGADDPVIEATATSAAGPSSTTGTAKKVLKRVTITPPEGAGRDSSKVPSVVLKPLHQGHHQLPHKGSPSS